MKHILLTTIAAVVLVGCGESQQSAPAPEAKPVEPVAEVPVQPLQPSPPPAESKPAEPVAEAAKPEPRTAEAPDISIHQAAKDGNIEAVKQHLDAGTDVNTKDGLGRTPLYRVTNKEIIELLIANGADVNAKANDGWTPLHWAANWGHKETIELLIAGGADVNAMDESDGTTPLDWAGFDLMNLLRKHGGKTGAELKAEGK